MSEVGQERGWGQLRGIDTVCRILWRGKCDDFGNMTEDVLLSKDSHCLYLTWLRCLRN